jgi:hypothetical protein
VRLPLQRRLEPLERDVVVLDVRAAEEQFGWRDDAGRETLACSPSGSPPRRPDAARTRTQMTPAASTNETGFRVARCETRFRQSRTGGGPCGSPGQNSAGPSNRSIAGTSSTETRSPVATVIAIPGPKERKKASVPTMSDATPNDTTAPAVKTIGVLSTVERRTASRVGKPSRSASRALLK